MYMYSSHRKFYIKNLKRMEEKLGRKVWKQIGIFLVGRTIVVNNGLIREWAEVAWIPYSQNNKKVSKKLAATRIIVLEGQRRVGEVFGERSRRISQLRAVHTWERPWVWIILWVFYDIAPLDRHPMTPVVSYLNPLFQHTTQSIFFSSPSSARAELHHVPGS